MSTKPFYNHIAGLRGIAIILVILFHLNSTCFSHGFFGVDVFLVISGYLLFLSASRQNYQLNIKEFATKKLFRIFPPMIILLLITMLGAIFFLDGDNLINTSRTGRYALVCYANLFLERILADYFAPNALENPFLHMWYLSVTIQLYVMFAIGCVVYRYIPKKLSMILLWSIGIASFCYGYSYQLRDILQSLGVQVWSQNTPVSHYYTLPRIWELLAGGAIMLLPGTNRKTIASLLTILGLGAVLCISLSSGLIASYGAPMVVAGTMLIVRYMPDSVLMPALSNKVMLWVGGISFSLYLVHMPIIAFYLISFQQISSWSDYAIIISLSLVLGWLFWRFVEKRTFKACPIIVLWIICMILCVLGKKLDDFKNKMHPELQSIRLTPYDDWKFCDPSVLANELDIANMPYNDNVFDQQRTSHKPEPPASPLMHMGIESTTPSLLLIGDSHANSAYFGLNRLCKDMNVAGVYHTATFIPLWDYVAFVSKAYYINRDKAEAFIKWLKANPCITHVIIAQYWRSRLNNPRYAHWNGKVDAMSKELMHHSLREFVKQIHNLGRHVILLGPTPEAKCSDPVRHIRTAMRKGQNPIDLSPLTSTHQEIAELNKDVLDILHAIQAEGLCSVLDVLSVIPENEPFVAYKDGKVLLSDDDHLSGDGATEIFRRLRPQLETLLKQPMPAK